MFALRIIGCIITGLCFAVNCFLTVAMAKEIKNTDKGRGVLCYDIILTVLTLALFIANLWSVTQL